MLIRLVCRFIVKPRAWLAPLARSVAGAVTY